MSTPAWAQPRGEAERGQGGSQAGSVASAAAADGSIDTAGAGGSTETAGAAAAAAGGSAEDCGKAIAEAHFRAVVKQKNHGKADWWQHFEPVLLKKEGKNWECKLKCIRGGPEACGALLSAKNPSTPS